MAATMLETVWLYLAEAFAGIRPEDGYRHTVRTVTTDPAQLEALPTPLTPACVLLYDESASRTPAVSMPGVDEYTMAFRSLWRVDAIGTDTESRVKAFADLRDDVRRAVATDPTCGGVAIDTRIVTGSGPEIENGRIYARWDLTVTADVQDEAS